MKVGSHIIDLDTVSSTNNYALALLEEEKPVDGTVITAGYQSGGRGQEGNSWESEKGRNLLFTIILYPHFLRPDRQFRISMAISAGIKSFLDRQTGDISIKWPNDIYAGNDKIAGILIENAIAGEKMVYSVIGIGLNVNQVSFSSALPNPVSLKLLTGKDYDNGLLLGSLLREIDRQYALLRSGKAGVIEAYYHSSMYRRGRSHLFRSQGREFSGVIEGVDNSGRLVVAEDGGRSLKAYMFREIEYL